MALSTTPFPTTPFPIIPLFELCEVHGERLRLVCMEDYCRTKVCDDCVHFGAHKGHSIKLMKEITMDMNDKKAKLKDVLDKLKEQEKTIESLVEEERVGLRRDVREKFKELKKIVDSKESELLWKIDTFFKVQKMQLTQVLGTYSNIAKEISEKLEERENIFLKSNFFDIMQEDISPVLSKLNLSLVQEYNEMVRKDIKHLIDITNNSLSERIYSLVELDFCARDIIEEAYIEILNGSRNDLRELKFKSHLDIETDQGVAKISISSNEIKEVAIDPNEWSKMNFIDIQVSYYDLTEDDMKLLCYITSHLSELSRIVIKFHPEGISDSFLIELLPRFFEGIKTTQEIKISFEKCKVGDESITVLFREILTNFCCLKGLNLVLDSTNITDKSLQVLGKETLPLMKELETLKIYLFNTNVSDEGASSLFIRMESIKALLFHLQKTQVTDASIECFVKNMLNSAISLESLRIFVSQTQITDKGVTHLFENMRDLKRLLLDLYSTNVTNHCIDALFQKALPRLISLKHLWMDLRNTKISVANTNKVGDLISKLRWHA